MIIKDNFLDNILVNILKNRILKSAMYFTNLSNDIKDDRFFQSAFDLNDVHTEYICRKLIDMSNKNLKFLRAYANIQFKDMNGNWHEDDGDYTFLLMISNTLPKGDGCFETKDKSVDFVKNRCIMFSAKEQHRGLSSKFSNEPRITLAFKSKEYNGNN